MATKNFIEELEWRGMIHTIMPGAKEQLEKEMTTAYLGIDPTADSLHIGHLVGVMILKHFQMCGHRPLALIGGATGMIGDPSGKSQERNLLDEPTLRHNQEAIKRQLAKLLDFDSDAPNAAALVNNYDWMKEFTFLDFIRDIGKCITVNYMMAKDSVKKRFNGEGDGMSFTEFTYQLVQGYDFLHLYETMNCKIQLGGADQWGNITTGTELIRRKLGAEAEAFGITCPLITKADGTKFGKTESGNVWLDPRYTSPYKFYQFWLNVSDEDAKRYIKIFTLLDRETIDALIAEHDAAPHLRVLQKRLAEEITCMIHSREEYERPSRPRPSSSAAPRRRLCTVSTSRPCCKCSKACPSTAWPARNSRPASRSWTSAPRKATSSPRKASAASWYRAAACRSTRRSWPTRCAR